MIEKNTEDTIVNPEEEETSDIETSDQEQEPLNPEDREVVAQRDKLYARLKKEEERRRAEEAKRRELELQIGEMQVREPGNLDAAGISAVMSAFAGLDSRERAKLLQESKLKKTSLIEARKDEDFKLWRSAYRAKKEIEKAPEPSTKQDLDVKSPKARVKRFTQGELSPKEEEEFLRELGVISDYGRPPPPPRGNRAV